MTTSNPTGDHSCYYCHIICEALKFNCSKGILKHQEKISLEHKIDCIDRAYDQVAVDLDRRLNKLELINTRLENDDPIHIQLKRIDGCFRKFDDKVGELDERIERLSITVKTILETQTILVTQNKKPHKCPACDGEGSIKKEIHPKLAEFERLPACLSISCNACESKGIVWG